MTTAAIDVLKQIDTDLLDPSAFQYRRDFPKKDHKEITESIKERIGAGRPGILQPLILRPSPDTKGRFQIVAGERRWRAAKDAKLETVPAIVREYTDEQAMEDGLVENLQRRDIHALDEALGFTALYRGLLALDGTLKPQTIYDHIGTRLGKHGSYVQQRMKLAELVPGAQKAFRDGAMQNGHAILLARLTEAQQLEYLPRIVDSSLPMTVSQLSREIESSVHRDLAHVPWDLDDADLFPAAGSCTACPKRTGSNPGLFPDVKAVNTCTDPACFQQKRNLALDARLKAMTEKNGGVEPLRVSLRFDHPAEGELARGQWQEAKKGTAGAQLAIISSVYGRNDSEGELGDTLYVTRIETKASKKRAGRAGSATKPAAKEERKKEREKGLVRRAGLDHLVAEVAGKAPSLVMSSGFRCLLVAALFETRSLYGERGEKALAEVGVTVKLPNPMAQQERVFEALQRLSPEKQHAALVKIVIQPELQPNRSTTPLLDALAELTKVDKKAALTKGAETLKRALSVKTAAAKAIKKHGGGVSGASAARRALEKKRPAKPPVRGADGKSRPAKKKATKPAPRKPITKAHSARGSKPGSRKLARKK